MKIRVIIYILLTSLLVPTVGICDDYAKARKSMVENQLAARDIADPNVLKVMGEIPRHEFVPVFMKTFAYADRPLPIGNDQTISQPYIVALMTQTLGVAPTDRVLEIGTGSGYQAAVLSKLAKEVYTIEIVKELADKSAKTLKGLGYKNVHVKFGDGFDGWTEHAPFDAIIITAAADRIPPPLLKQLRDGGKIIMPKGDTTGTQTLSLFTKKGDKLDRKDIALVRFVPFTGKISE